MAKLEVTNDQLRIIQAALDFYSRVGIGQMTAIKDHPTFISILSKALSSNPNDKDGSGEVTPTIDYSKYHDLRNSADAAFTLGRDYLLQDQMGINAHLGIFNPSVDDSCRVAFDIIQVIRHEFWKANPDRDEHSVASDVMTWTDGGDLIKCELD